MQKVIKILLLCLHKQDDFPPHYLYCLRDIDFMPHPLLSFLNFSSAWKSNFSLNVTNEIVSLLFSTWHQLLSFFSSLNFPFFRLRNWIHMKSLSFRLDESEMKINWEFLWVKTNWHDFVFYMCEENSKSKSSLSYTSICRRVLGRFLR